MSDNAATAHPGSPFWRFSLRFYRMPNVAPACLTLQDEAGVDVNVLLYLLWNATRGQVLDEADVMACDSLVAGWREKAVVPLRAMRRALKDAPGPGDKAVATAFRDRVKGLELEAERIEQEALFALAAPVAGAPDAATVDATARANVETYQALFQKPFSPGAIDDLLEAVGALHAPPRAAGPSSSEDQ